MANFIFISNVFASFFLCGLIWTVQVVHYPMFHRLDKQNFTDHIEFHKSGISFIVVPVMLLELGTSIWLSVIPHPFRVFHIAGLAVVLLIWTSTFFIQVPLHNRLSDNRSEQMISKLVQTNWSRTFLWSCKSVLGAFLLWKIIL